MLINAVFIATYMLKERIHPKQKQKIKNIKERRILKNREGIVFSSSSLFNYTSVQDTVHPSFLKCANLNILLIF